MAFGASGCGGGQLKDLMASGSDGDTGASTTSSGTTMRRVGYAEVTNPPEWRGVETFLATDAEGSVLCEYEWRTDSLKSINPSVSDPLESNCFDRANSACRFSFTILKREGAVVAGAECDSFSLEPEDPTGQGYGFHDDYDAGTGPVGPSLLKFTDDGTGSCCWNDVGGEAAFLDNRIDYDHPDG